MKNSFVVTCIVVIIIIGGCIFGNDNEKEELDSETSTFPLTLGNRWEYSAEVITYNMSESTDTVTTDTTYYSSIQVVSKEIEIDSGTTEFVIHEQRTEQNQQIDINTYYHEKPDGLYLVAYDNASMLTLKQSSKESIYYKGRHFNSISEITSWIMNALPTAKIADDSLFYENPQPKSLQYPLEVGARWVYRQKDNPWRIDKKIVGTENAIVPAGTFMCYKIEWLCDIDEDNEWDEDIVLCDYICSIGLIQRVITMKGMTRTTEYSSEIIDIFDSSENINMTDYYIEK